MHSVVGIEDLLFLKKEENTVQKKNQKNKITKAYSLKIKYYGIKEEEEHCNHMLCSFGLRSNVHS